MRDDPRAVFIVDEMGTLEGIKSRNGRQSAGDAFGAHGRHARPDQSRRGVEPHASLRSRTGSSCWQRSPGEADVLLSDDEIHTGTPQRFIWELAVDPTAPQERPSGRVSWSGQLPEDLPRHIDYPQRRR